MNYIIYYMLEGEGYCDFRITDLVKNSDEIDI